MASQWKQQTLDIGKETTWNTLASTFIRMVNVANVTFKATDEVIERPVINARLTRTSHVMGRQGGTLAFDWYMSGGGVANPSAGVATTAPELDPVLDAVFTKTLGKSRTYSSGGGAGASTVTVATPAASDFNVGGRMTSVATGESRIVTGFDSGTGVITVDRAFVTAITTGVIAASTVYTRKDSTPNGISCRFDLDGKQYRATGGRVTKLSVPALKGGQLAVMHVEIEFNDYDETAFTAETAATYPSPPVVKGGTFSIGGTQYDAQDYEIDFAPKQAFIDAIDGTEGRAGIEIADWETGGSFAVEEAKDAQSDFAAGTELSNISYTAGNAYNGIGLWVAKAQFTDHEHVNVNGYRMDKVPFKANDNTTTSTFALSTGA